MKNFTIFPNITAINEPHYTDIETIYKRITTDHNKELIEKIRGCETKAERNQYKKQLPSICFSGKFTKRMNSAITEHSGLVCLDFDHIDVDELKSLVCADKYTLMAFTSPSGDGLKVVVKIPAKIETHASSCRALKEYYKNEKLDSFEDVARVCYESYDKEAFFNNESEVFTDMLNEQIIERTYTTQESDPNQIFDKLKKWIEKYDTYSDGNKHTFLVKFAGALNRFGVNESSAIAQLSREYQNSASYVKYADFEKIVIRVYGNYRNQHNTSFFETNGTAIEKYTSGKVEEHFANEYQKFAEEENNDTEQAEYEKLKSKLTQRFIDPNSVYDKPTELISIQAFDMHTARFMTAGNISAFTGKAKSKKSYFQTMLVASAAANEALYKNMVVTIPENKREILLFDTEQAEYDVWKVTKRVERIAGRKLPNLGVFSLRGMDAKEIIQLIDFAVTQMFKNVSIIFIDQIADMVKSLNDEAEAVSVVKFLERITKDLDIHVSTVIHQNKHDNYAQGWLGTQVIKKSETVAGVTKDHGETSISHIEASHTRGMEFEPFSIFIDDKGLPQLHEQAFQMSTKTI